ncbi:uncharacterized protein [Montipora capricornis]|uniref:uncharacterized protein n=1 Tax=Montipora capricornis TaxID=246305 RepID=UPI0035F16A61
MSIRLLCKRTSKRPSNALFYFPEEQKTGIAPTRIIDEKDLDLTPGMVVTVNWDREKVEAEILALDDELKVLNEKDLEWSKEHLTAQTAATEEKKSTNSDTESPNKPLERTKKSVQPRRSREKEAQSSENPYEQFLAAQKKRALEWKSARDSKRAKSVPVVNQPPEASSVQGDCRQEDTTKLLRQQLHTKTTECNDLKRMLKSIEEQNVLILKNQTEMQEKFFKLLEKIQVSISEIKDSIATCPAASNFGGYLNPLLEHDPENLAGAIIIPDSADRESPVKDVAKSAEQTRYLSTINYDTLSNLREENQPSDVPSAAKRQGSASQDVGKELISTCVTPTRIKTIQETLSKPETDRHLCALKLLPHFFSKEELAESNTDGSHGKKFLDSTKLNSLKLLVFSKFPASTSEETDKAWRFIKGKINTKCRAVRRISLPDSTPSRPE